MPILLRWGCYTRGHHVASAGAAFGDGGDDAMLNGQRREHDECTRKASGMERWVVAHRSDGSTVVRWPWLGDGTCRRRAVEETEGCSSVWLVSFVRPFDNSI
jgi:hypothetical protein